MINGQDSLEIPWRIESGLLTTTDAGRKPE